MISLLIIFMIVFNIALEGTGVGSLSSAALAEEGALRPLATAENPDKIRHQISNVKISPEKIRQFGEELSITEKDFLAAVETFPRLARYNPKRVKEDFERELGIGKEALAKAILTFPQLVSLDVKRVKKEFRTGLGIGKAALAKAILKHPPLAGYGVTNNLKPKMQIIDEMGVAEEKRVDGLIALASSNVTLLILIWQRSLQLDTKIESPYGLLHKYKRLNKCVKQATGKTATVLVKTSQESTPLIEEVIIQILEGKTKIDITVPQRLIDIAENIKSTSLPGAKLIEIFKALDSAA